MYDFGKANINISELIAGEISNWEIIYEVGCYGIDDTGEILIARRDVCDSQIPQFEDPNLSGYVNIYGYKINAKLSVNYIPNRYIRPWKSCISIKVFDGSLKKGDKIHIQFGSNQGYRIQTFKEEKHMFKILIDCAGSGIFYEIKKSPTISIIGGYPVKYEAVSRSIVTKGDAENIYIRSLDSWGNIAEKCNKEVILKISNTNLKVDLKNGLGIVKNYKFNKEGIYYPKIYNYKKQFIGIGNPILCKKNSNRNLYWGDMHGQTGETVGTGTPDLYFSFARDKGYLDFCAWQGNDFQVTDELWKIICKTTSKYNEPHRFITFLGYEWSGTTPTGGDHNIYFLGDNQKIFRSYHWQIDMNKNDGSDRNPISKLWEEFKGRTDVMAVPHVGGRYGNLDFFNKEFIYNLEIHSHHGTFEWFFEDALKRGLKFGIVAASDDHTCRPGLAYPTRASSRGGFTSFDVNGGYTAIYSKELTRQCLWESLKQRHCYGTTGERILLDVSCEDKMMGDEFIINHIPKINVNVVALDIIEELEIKRGLDTIYRYSDLLPINKNRVKIKWSGVRVKSRSKKTIWDGKLVIKEGNIKSVKKFAFNQPDENVMLFSNQVIEWESSTSGDFDGIEFDLDYNKNTMLIFYSQPIVFNFKIHDLYNGRIIKEAGGINQKVEISFSKYATDKQLEINFEDKNIKSGVNTYWVKVIQKNGHMAWSSPMFINYKV